MRYVIVDLEASSREHFSTRGDVLEALRDVAADDPGYLEELFIVKYDDSGTQVDAPERGDEALASVIFHDAAETGYVAIGAPIVLHSTGTVGCFWSSPPAPVEGVLSFTPRTGTTRERQPA
ncbi:MAG TPA: hypothetical protein VFU65_09490 [Actinocrinis sp.]|nr:hypothetical protein [Actinocrinis sp.]